MRFPNRLYLVPIFSLLILFFSNHIIYSQEATPTASTPISQEQPEIKNPSRADEATISKPEAASAEEEPSTSVVGQRQKPSQGEGEKAPVSDRPAAVPEFSLPEVVITGENELTIGAKRLERREEDVTLGSHDLTGIDRAFDDLPGLNKTFTALSTEEAGPSRDTALVLHLGGGIPNTYGGWGLFGQEFKGLQYLLTGNYSHWGGESIVGGFDGDQRSGVGGEIKLFRSSPLSFLLSGGYNRNQAELPYQGSFQEWRDSIQLNVTADWKISPLVQAQMKISNQSTALTFWDQTPKNNQVQELEAQFKISADDVDRFLNRFSVEAGGQRGTSNFPVTVGSTYDWGWFGLQGFFKGGENLNLTAKLQAQGGGGLNLPFKFYPVFNLMWRAFENSQFNLYYKTDRFVERFENNYLASEHLSPKNGFPSPSEVTGEWGGRLTQKLSEGIILSLSASSAQIANYHQWTDITPGTPAFIQTYGTLGSVRMNKAGANLQWNFTKDWQAAATYQWTQGTNNSGNGLNLTGLPTHKGVLSLYHSDDKLETRLELLAASERQKFDSAAGILPAYFTVGLDATYRVTKNLSFWMNGDNLLGQSYQLQPGYPEPRFHVRAGIEVIF